ncbi:MAG: putative lipid II flippase FtsW [candidate division Zixibacteria bacterium]|nr:putative lipid II flippase FtsW [candidate division Zixibacteria bacterium]
MAISNLGKSILGNIRLGNKSREDSVLLYSFLVLVLVGVVMVYSTSSMLAENRFGSHTHFLKRQLIWMAVSAFAMIGVYYIDLKKLGRYTPLFILAAVITLSMTFFMPARNEAQRWIFWGPLTVQPSEFAKIALVYYLAFSLSRTTRDLRDYRNLLVPYAPVIGLVLLLILLEPDLGVTIVLGLTVVSIFFMAGARLLHLGAAASSLVAVAGILVLGFGYKIARVRDYISTLQDPLEGSYQVKQAILTMGSGGAFGVGLGDGRQKLFFLPYPHTDFIFAAIGEELGFIGLAALLTLFFIVLYRGLRIASQQPDRFGYLLASGITLCLFFNIAVNIGVVVSLLPTTGLPLPFISYGGFSLVMSSLMVGILLNLSRRRDGWIK